jgi:hypothetical protein
MSRGGDDHDRNRLIRALTYFLVSILVMPPLAVAFRVDLGIALLLSGTLGICLVVTTFVLASIGI